MNYNKHYNKTRRLILAGQLWHIKDVCQKTIQHDAQHETGPQHWTDRHWLAQTILNILNGNIDQQIMQEAHINDD